MISSTTKNKKSDHQDISKTVKDYCDEKDTIKYCNIDDGYDRNWSEVTKGIES